jgi:hypothetical protein
MAYSSNLKSWGDSGVEFPDGHSHAANSGHVDAYENFFKHNAIADILWLIDEVNGSTNTSVSEDDAPVASDVADINFVGPVNVQDDQDGTVTVNLSHNHDSRYFRKSNGELGEGILNKNYNIESVWPGNFISSYSETEGSHTNQLTTVERTFNIFSTTQDFSWTQFSVGGFDVINFFQGDKLVLPESSGGGSDSLTTGSFLWYDTSLNSLVMERDGQKYTVDMTPV